MPMRLRLIFLAMGLLAAATACGGQKTETVSVPQTPETQATLEQMKQMEQQRDMMTQQMLQQQQQQQGQTQAP